MCLMYLMTVFDVFAVVDVFDAFDVFEVSDHAAVKQNKTKRAKSRKCDSPNRNFFNKPPKIETSIWKQKIHNGDGKRREERREDNF